MRSAAAYASARPSCSAVAPRAIARRAARRPPRRDRRRASASRGRRRPSNSPRRLPTRDTSGSASSSSATSAARSWGCRHAPPPRTQLAPRRLLHQGRQHLAGRVRPTSSSASNALFVKSRVWPPSMKTWSVTAANIMRSTSAESRRWRWPWPATRSAASRRPGVDEAPVPAREPIGIDVVVVERAEREARRVVARVARDERQPVHQRERPVVVVEVRQQVRHRDEHGEPGAPSTAAVPRARSRRRAGRSRPGHTGSSRPSTAFARTRVSRPRGRRRAVATGRRPDRRPTR